MVLFLCFLLASFSQASDQTEHRIDALLPQLSLEEKISLLHGVQGLMENNGIPRLHIPSIKMTDGPLGVRWDSATAFPSAISLASSFHPEMMEKLAVAMGEETLAKGRDMLLGPCVNISRNPYGGRNFESYGEDPVLTSAFARAWLRGVQSRGVIGSTKHFAGNEQEFQRETIDVRIDERALHEIHLPAFLAAIREGTFTVMSSYNRLNGTYTSESVALLSDLLKKRWGFRGFVISDWGANHSTVESANAGLDMEMPMGEFWANGRLAQAVVEGKVSVSTIDDKVRRILRVMMESGQMDRKDADRPPLTVVNSPEHRSLALQAAQESLVLLKNENGILPLQNERIKKVAVIGPNAATARNNGGGSSRVVPYYNVSPLQGLKNRSNFELSFAPGVAEIDEFPAATGFTSLNEKGERVPGLKAEFFAGISLAGEPLARRIDPAVDFLWGEDSPAPGVPKDNFSVRWRGTYRAARSGNFEIAVRSDDGSRVFFDGKLLLDDWTDHAPVTHRIPVQLEAGRDYEVTIEYFDRIIGAQIRFGIMDNLKSIEENYLAAARDAARAADVALVFVGSSELWEGEGVDRRSLSLPSGQDKLVETVAAANPNTIVILNSGGSLLMPWRDRVSGIVQAWYPGQEGGNAIADLLLGRLNFSGKLPVSFYAREEDASSFGNYPGENGRVTYGEGLFVGYRHLDTRKIEPLFPFGFGLSYTKFDLAGLKVSGEFITGAPKVLAQVKVTNTGAMAGAEVVQLYVHAHNPKVEKPEQELKAFARVFLEPGESKWVNLELPAKAFAYYDQEAHEWRQDPGSFELRVGNSSRNLPLIKSIQLEGPSALLPE